MTNILIIVVTVLVAHFRALRCGYTIDDIERFNDKSYTPKGRLQRFWWRLRGIKYSNPEIEHLINIVIHGINSVLLYFAFGYDGIAFTAALLFAVNAAGHQGSLWLSGTGYALATMCILLMVIVRWFAPFLYLFSFYWAPSAVGASLLFFKTLFWPLVFMPLLPVVILRLVAFMGGKLMLRRRIRPLLRYICGIPIRKALKRRLAMRTGIQRRFYPKKLIVVLKSLGYYAYMAVFPLRLGVYHNYLYTYGLSQADTDYWERADKYFWVGVFIAYVLVTNFFWNDAATVRGLFWFVVLVLPFCNAITMQQGISERFLYAALPGMSYFVSAALRYLGPWYVQAGAFLVLFTYYFFRLQLQINAYKDLKASMEYGSMNFPDCYAYWTWRGQLEKDAGSFFTALEAWFKGWKMRPVDFRLNNNIAVMLTDMGYLDDAESFLKNAEEHIIPEQKKAADAFIAHERARIVVARKLLEKMSKNSVIANRGLDAWRQSK